MKLLQWVSIRSKLVLIMLATTGVALGVACAAFITVDFLSFRRSVAMHLQSLARVVGSNCALALAFDDPRAAAEELGALAHDRRALGACLYDANHRFFAGYKCDGLGATPPLTSAEPHFKGSRVEVHSAIALEDDVIGSIALVGRADFVSERLTQYIGILIVMLAMSMLAAAVLTLRLQRQVSGPILRLVDLVRRVSKEDAFGMRAAVESDDEIGQLATGLNDMLAQIEKRDAALAESRRLLEQRVEERTRDLQNEIAEHRRVDAALRESEKKYRGLIETSSDLIWSVDAEGRYTFVNQAARKIFGYEPEEMMGRPFTDFADPDQAARDMQIFDHIKAGHPRFHYDTVHIRKDGKPVHLSFNAIVLRDDEGRPIGTTGTAVDMTERTKAEAREKELQTRLARAERLESLGILAGGVAHDLNNMLGPMVGYPDMILEQLPPDSPLRDDVEQIRESSKRAAAVIQDLLTLARRGNLQTVPVQLNRVVESFLKSPQLRELKALHPKVEVVVQTDASLQRVPGSIPHLNQVISNLVTNAFEAMPSGGKLTISTSSEALQASVKGYDAIAKGRYAVLRVADTGVGIEKDDLERIFEPFYTKKKMGRSGSGLGLAVVYGVVRDLNGYIDVKTAIGEGTQFSIYLPEGAAEGRDASDDENVAGGTEAILVIDDVPEQRALAVRLLSSLGYRVDAAPDGKAALERVRQNGVDLLVLDMVMEEGFDGLDTYREVLKIHPGQRCVIVTGFSESERVKGAIALGAAGMVRKPYTRASLGRAVRKELDRA